MADEQSKEEIILEAEKKLCSDSNHRPLSFDMILLQNGIPFKKIRDICFFDWMQHKIENPKAFSKESLVKILSILTFWFETIGICAR